MKLRIGRKPQGQKTGQIDPFLKGDASGLSVGDFLSTTDVSVAVARKSSQKRVLSVLERCLEKS